MSSSLISTCQSLLELGKKSEEIIQQQNKAEFEFFAENYKLTGKHHPLWTLDSQRAIGINGENLINK